LLRSTGRSGLVLNRRRHRACGRGPTGWGGGGGAERFRHRAPARAGAGGAV